MLGVLAGQKANKGSILDELNAPVAAIEEVEEEKNIEPEAIPSAPIE